MPNCSYEKIMIRIEWIVEKQKKNNSISIGISIGKWIDLIKRYKSSPSPNIVIDDDKIFKDSSWLN